MKRFSLLFLLLSSSIIYGQFTITLMGEVRLDKKGLENCHVENKNTGNATITDANGNFFINVSEGDMLRLTHLSATTRNVLVTKQHVKQSVLAVTLEAASTALEEVSLSHNSRITAESVRLPNAGKPVPTANERRLATAGDFKPIQLLGLLGGNLPLDPIINAISGRTARLKKQIEADKKIAVNEALVWYYEEWLRKRLEITEDETLRFMDFLSDDEEISTLLRENNDVKVQIYLLDQYVAFQKIQNNPNPIEKKVSTGF